MRKCPLCVEVIHLEATKCKHCGESVPKPILDKASIQQDSAEVNALLSANNHEKALIAAMELKARIIYSANPDHFKSELGNVNYAIEKLSQAYKPSAPPAIDQKLNIQSLGTYSFGFTGEKGSVFRWKVVGGWLVMVSGTSSFGGMTFVPDPAYEWDGKNMT